MSEEWGKATKLDFELESAPWAVESAGTHHEWELTHLRDENELHCPFFFFLLREVSIVCQIPQTQSRAELFCMMRLKSIIMKPEM